MEQTPVHDNHNPDLLRIIPSDAKRVIEIGCSSGALAREYKKNHENVNWVGVEIDQSYAEMAKRYCDSTLVANIDDCDDSFYEEFSDRDCWVFGDTLEHLKDPWSVLQKIRNVMPAGGSVAVCIPNAQHWSLIIKFALGEFRYEDSGLLDKTHLRWFSRKTMLEMFQSSGLKVVEGFPRIFNEQSRGKYLPLIADIAKFCGKDPEMILKDATPLQYVIRAVPM